MPIKRSFLGPITVGLTLVGSAATAEPGAFSEIEKLQALSSQVPADLMRGLRQMHAMGPAALPKSGRHIADCVDADGNPPDGEDFCIIQDKLGFDAIDGIPTTRDWGILNGAGFRIEVPDNWNGDLVMYAHGFRGTTPVDDAAGRACRAEITVDSHPIRPWLIANGFAWAASSYHRNCYDVRAGVNDTNALAREFYQTYGPANRTFITGASMGGHVTGAAIEMFPNYDCQGSPVCARIVGILGELTQGVRYDGAMPFCGVMGDNTLFDYFLDYNLAARQLATGQSSFPPPADFLVSEVPLLIALLSGPAFDTENGLIYPFVRSEGGDRLRLLLEDISGGPRPIFDQGYLFWESFFFLFGLGGDGSIPGQTERPVVGNMDRVYQLDRNPGISAEEDAFNMAIARVERDPKANRDFGPLILRDIPVIEGRLTQPVLSMHTLGDLFVPFVMQQTYTSEVQANGLSELLVQRAIRDVGHCSFNGAELVEGFAELVNWVNTGQRPGGDDILDRANLADPAFGCQFTRGDRDGLPTCPELAH